MLPRDHTLSISVVSLFVGEDISVGQLLMKICLAPGTEWSVFLFLELRWPVVLAIGVAVIIVIIVFQMIPFCTKTLKLTTFKCHRVTMALIVLRVLMRAMSMCTITIFCTHH